MAKVSVIIPHNNNTDLEKTVYSVLNQNFRDFEIIIVSDRDVVLPADNRIKAIRLTGKYNTSQLLNAGIKHCESEHICFLNQNDLFLYNALKLRYEEFLKNSSLAACYGLGIDTDINFQVKSNQNYEYFTAEKVCLPENSIKTILSGGINLSISSIMVKRSVLENIKFNPFLKTTYTWDFIIKLFNSYEGKICQIPDPVYISSDEEHNHNNQKYFIDYLKESGRILDDFFNSSEVHENLKNIYLQCFKNLYSYMFFILVEYFPYNFWLRLYLLISYLKKNRQLNNELLDIWFISVLLNSLSISKRQILLNRPKTA